MNKPIDPVLPFIWPEPLVSAGFNTYVTELPFDVAVRTAVSVFGVVSAIDARAVNWMEGFLADRPETQLRLVVSIHPTCRTSELDLQELLRLVERHGVRAAFKVFPERSLADRSSNLLCLVDEGGNAILSVGPTENMGLAPTSPSQANLASSVSAATFEACRKWFDYLWGISGSLRPDIAASMPNLVLPQGDEKSVRMWAEYCQLCLDKDMTGELPVKAIVDPETGDVQLVDQNNDPVASPTEEIGIQKLDPLAEYMARIFELGSLVSIDKLSRIPPLEAPVKPEWFGVDSFRQTGVVRAQT